MRHSTKTGMGMQREAPTREVLAEAFASFTQAAGLLEASYKGLQQELAGLRQELEEKNRNLESSLQENQSIRRYLQDLLETLPCGVAILGGTQRLQLCNPEAVRLLEGIDNGAALLAAAAGETDPHNPEEEREIVLAASRQPRYLTVRQTRFAAGDGEPRILLILRDTSAQHRLEEERQHARCLQALAESSALLAHEVRNPLASMELFASLLVDAAGATDELRHWAKNIQAGLRMIAATVNNVLHLRDPGPLQLRSADLAELLGSTVQLLEPVAHQCGVHIELLGAGRAIPVMADQSRLQQVFFNLAVNAFRAMEPGGTLTIHVRTNPPGAVEVDFADQGCGIAPEDLERIFEPGFSRTAGGSGFGLAVCRKIMDQHGGSIRIASRVGTGTTIALAFAYKGEVG
jgi:two-component system sensor histidine kinase FlrB